MKLVEETRVKLTNTCLAVAALAAIAAPASASQADDTFKAFRQVCGDTRADYAAASAAAAQNGWKATDVMGNAMPGVTLVEKAGRSRSVGDAALVVSMTHGTAAKDPTVNVYTCTLQTDRGGYPELKGQAQTWLGFAPAASTDTLTTFRFTEENGKLRAAADSDFNAAAAGTGMQILTVKRDGASAILDYVKIRKLSAAQ